MFGSKSDKKCDKKEYERISKCSDEERKKEYHEKGRDAWEKAWAILNTEDGWRAAAGTDLETGKVCYQHFPGVGRVFKLQGLVSMSPERLFEEVVTHVENNPKWNPTVLESKIIEDLGDDMDICHNISATAAGGLVASRDFVTVRHWKEQNGMMLSAGISVPHPKAPPSKKYVRGFNNPGGWFFSPVGSDPNSTILGWIMSTDLRGWLPHTVIDQVIPNTLMEFLNHTRIYVENDLKLRTRDHGDS